MILGVYTIFDRVGGFYSPPFYMAHVGEARRAFADLARDRNTSIGRSPEDYVMYCLGEFDNESGQHRGALPEFVCGASGLARSMPPAPEPAKQEL